jgi:hypothetical protein
MRALIVEHISHGHTRFCGSRCHHAKSKLCRCICKGILHGAALRQLELPFKPAHLETAADSTGRLHWVAGEPHHQEAS